MQAEGGISGVPECQQSVELVVVHDVSDRPGEGESQVLKSWALNHESGKSPYGPYGSTAAVCCWASSIVGWSSAI